MARDQKLVNKRNGPSSRRLKWQKGNHIIEAALITIPFLILLTATLDVCVALYLKLTFEHAAREGARFAITNRVQTTGQCHEAAIRDIVLRQSGGFLSPNNITVNYLNYTNYASNSPTPVGGAIPWNQGGNEAGNVVEVRISGFSYAWMVPGFVQPGGASSLPITAASADRMEPPSATSAAPTRCNPNAQ
jgi:Flp pilus assembly protein TadG